MHTCSLTVCQLCVDGRVCKKGSTALGGMWFLGLLHAAAFWVSTAVPALAAALCPRCDSKPWLHCRVCCSQQHAQHDRGCLSKRSCGSCDMCASSAPVYMLVRMQQQERFGGLLPQPVAQCCSSSPVCLLVRAIKPTAAAAAAACGMHDLFVSG